MQAPTWTPDGIKRLRKGYGENQHEFAQRLRVTVDTISIWERGLGPPSGTAEALLDRLQEDLDCGKIRGQTSPEVL